MAMSAAITAGCVGARTRRIALRGPGV